MQHAALCSVCMCVSPPQPSPTQLPLPLDVGIPELLNAPSLAEICLKSSECEAGNEAMLSPSLCLPNVWQVGREWGVGGLFDLKMRRWLRRRKWERKGCGRWTSLMFVWGGVTSFAESLHPSCVFVLLGDCTTLMGGGWQVTAKNQRPTLPHASLYPIGSLMRWIIWWHWASSKDGHHDHFLTFSGITEKKSPDTSSLKCAAVVGVAGWVSNHPALLSPSHLQQRKRDGDSLTRDIADSTGIVVSSLTGPLM